MPLPPVPRLPLLLSVESMPLGLFMLPELLPLALPVSVPELVPPLPPLPEELLPPVELPLLPEPPRLIVELESDDAPPALPFLWRGCLLLVLESLDWVCD